MEKISKSKLKELLEKAKVEVEVSAKGSKNEESTYELGFQMDLCLSDDGSTEIEYRGFTAESFAGEKPIAKNFKDILKLFAYLEKENVFDGDEVTVVSYRSQYSTYQEHLEALAFDRIDMAGILEKYLPYADRFSLTYPYCDDPERRTPYGTYRLSKSHADAANAKVRNTFMKELFCIYEKISAEGKESLPPFEELMQKIEQEVKEYRAEHKREINKNGGNAFLCDKFSRGEAKYRAPQELWNFYHSIDLLCMFCWISDHMQKNEKEISLDAVLDDEYYLPLKSDLQNIEVTYCWHCTISSQLSRVFYFRLTGNSVAWLRNLRNDYDMKKLEDLAFYQGERVLFSSCTHENSHCDCMKEKKISG